MEASKTENRFQTSFQLPKFGLKKAMPTSLIISLMHESSLC